MGLIPDEEKGDITYSLKAIEEMQAICKANLDLILKHVTEADLIGLDIKDKMRFSKDLMSQFAYMEQTKISLYKQTDLSKKVKDLEEIIQKVPKELILKYGIDPANSVIEK